MLENFERVSADSVTPLVRETIEALPVNYAYATDCFGKATCAKGDQPLDSRVNVDDPLFAEGLSLYRKIFSKDFAFTLMVEGALIEVVSNPDSQSDSVLEWSNYVNNAFRKGQYKSTQHHIGSINSYILESSAVVQSYLIATHVYSEEAKNTGVSITWGTYTDEVSLEDGSWLIKARSLDVISTNTISDVSKLAVE